VAATDRLPDYCTRSSGSVAGAEMQIEKASRVGSWQDESEMDIWELTRTRHHLERGSSLSFLSPSLPLCSCWTRR
jgi:hypothetical protein